MPLRLFSEKTQNWFREHVGVPTQIQAKGWQAVASGKDVLLSAPTGMGKTLAAFLYWLDRLAQEVREASCSAPLAEGVRVLYISPLKALGNDIRENLQRPLEGLGLQGILRAQVRTGDTPPSERARMAKHPPQILITTPESLYLLLTSQSGRRMLRTTQCVICDEIHALLSTKRGVHLAISLERLDTLCGRRVQRIGLSATVRPPVLAGKYLTGARRDAAQIITSAERKRLDLRVEMANQNRALLREGSAWAAIAEKVYALSQKNRTSLAFVNGRAEAEKLAHHINAVAGAPDYARTHHGCISREQRLAAEEQLRGGTLRVLCCTSSMELGIDVGEIDLVVQVGAPGTVASLLQRAGRAGHGPEKTSVVRIFPKTNADALSCALVARGALEGELEPAHVPEMCLDVLAQHVVSMAAIGEWTVDEMLALFRNVYSYRELTKSRLVSVIRMLQGEQEHERDLPVRPRILFDRKLELVSGDNYTRMLACSSGGTIPDRGMYAVMLSDGTRLGELDEEFVFEARLGDKILLGAFAWKIVSITRDRVVVQQSSSEGAQSPFWRGDGAGRAYATGLYYGKLLREMNEAAACDKLDMLLREYPLSADAQLSVCEHVHRQIKALGSLGDDKHIVIEHFADEAGQHQLMLHSPLGQTVLRPLSMLLRAKARAVTGQDVQTYTDADGILLYLMGTRDLPDGLVEMLTPENARATIAALLPGEPLYTISFRYAAGRALMLGMRSGGRQPLWVQRLRSEEALAYAVQTHEHPLMWEACRECCDDICDISALETVLLSLQKGEMRIREVHGDVPSPMALPLRRQVEADMMYAYTPIPSAATRMAENAAEQLALVVPDVQALSPAYAEKEIRSAQELHSLLLGEGDLLTDEPGAHTQWLAELEEAGQVVYTEQGLWIAAEEEDLYAAAAMGDLEAMCRIARRCMKFRAPMDANALYQRYCLSPERAQEVLDMLSQEGLVCEIDGMFVHRDVYAAAQRFTTHRRRQEVQTQPGERLSALLARGCMHFGPPAEQLEEVLAQLQGLVLPLEQWEGMVFPARVTGYRPQVLDTVLAQGEFGWRIVPSGEQSLLVFERCDDGEGFVRADVPLTENEQGILRVLEREGAQFSQRIGKRLHGAPVEEALLHLASLGLVRKDSFQPVRRMLVRAKATGKHAPIAKMDTGRWERCRLPAKPPVEEEIERLSARCPILCREIVPGSDWQRLLPELRRMEYTERARRGYYIEGLSGAQFVLPGWFAGVTKALAEPSSEWVVLHANDPAQIWGRILPHQIDRQFLCIAQTAVVLCGGRVCAVFERSGEVLRLYERGSEAIAAFAKACKSGRVFVGKKRIVCKVFPKEFADAFTEAGFFREALDYVLEI